MIRRLSVCLVLAAVSLPSAALAQESPAADDFRLRPLVPPPPKPDTIQPTPSQPGPQPTSRPVHPWDFDVFGYIRVGYDYTMKDSRYDFIGQNNGFILDNARVGLDGSYLPYGVRFRVAIEGANDELSAPNTPIGTLSVRMRDVFARWDPYDFVGIQLGQFKAPWQEEELRGTNTLLFPDRSVGIDGILPGRGFQTDGIQLDRQLGVMVSPAKPIGNEAVGASYYFMVMNGNGPNQLLDDNGKVGLVGRVELGIYDYVRIGAGVFHNDRRVGTPPNLYDEEDFGITGDVSVKVQGFQAFGYVTRLHTTYPTVGSTARTQLAFAGQAGYRIQFPAWFIMPAYRYAWFNPWQSGGGDGFDSFKVQYHSFGVRAGLERLPIQAWLAYTVTQEESGRKLDNDRIQFMGQVSF